jgi:pimeloyl-ACP methyl ester carboxylesterase
MKHIMKKMAETGQMAALKHGAVRYQLEGPENGAMVVLVHGLAGHMHIWDKNFDFLVAQGYRVLRMDLYGRGFSARVQHPYTAELFVTQVAGLLQHLAIDTKLNLIGLSMGGAIITRFATTYPERVASMLWVDSYGIPTPKEPLMRLTRPRVLGELLMGVLGGPILRQAPKRGVHMPNEHPGFNQWFAAPLAIKGSKRALLSTSRHFLRDNHVPHFERVNAMDIPKLMVWGRHDKILSLDYGQQLHALVPTARWEVYEQSGHLPHFEEPEKFNAMMEKFLKQ